MDANEGARARHEMSLRVIVTDNGSPPLSATQLVTIVVNEVNLAPCAPIARQFDEQ